MRDREGAKREGERRKKMRGQIHRRRNRRGELEGEKSDWRDMLHMGKG